MFDVRPPSLASSYPVCFTSDVFDLQNDALVQVILGARGPRRRRVAAIVDRGALAGRPELCVHIERYAGHHREVLDLVAPPIVQGGGSGVKSDPILPARLQAYLHALELDHESLLFVAGGTSLLDLAGFAAGTVRRAPRVIRLPTTTASQVGPAVLPGNTIDAFGTKDFLGTPAAPFAVVCDRRFPETQRTREKVFGLVFALRAALLWDAELFAWIVRHVAHLAGGERDAVAALVERSAALHAEHGMRAPDGDDAGDPLALGAWSAERIELQTERRTRRGEALAVGIALDVAIGARASLLAARDREAVLGALERLGLRLWSDALGNVDSEGRLLLLDGLLERSFGETPRIPLLRGIGGGVVMQDLDEGVLREAITELADRDARRAHAWALA
jgi:3-dehydroquinate synthase